MNRREKGLQAPFTKTMSASVSALRKIVNAPRVRKARLSFLQSYHESGRLFSNPDFYEYLSLNEDLTRQLISRWLHYVPRQLRRPYKRQFLAGKRPRPPSKQELSAIDRIQSQFEEALTFIEAKLGWPFLSLLADPAIVVRFPQFKAWLMCGDSQATTPYGIRMEYARHLGSRRTYRVLSLDSETARELPSKGLGNLFVQSPETKNEFMHVLQDHLLPYDSGDARRSNPPHEMLAERAGPFQQMLASALRSSLITTSLTDYPILGASITGFAPMMLPGIPRPGPDTGGGKRNHGLYLVKLELHRIDLSHLEFVRVISRFRKDIRIKTADGMEEVLPFFGRGTECFTFEKLLPEQILGIEEYQGPVGECRVV